MTVKKTISADFNSSPEMPAAAIVTAFFEAAGKGEAEQVRDFIEKFPVLVEWKEPVLKSTALIVAAKAGHPEVVKVLLDGGGDIDAVDAGAMNAICQAAMHGRRDVCDLLISEGADPTMPGRHGISAVACANAAEFPSLADHLVRQMAGQREQIRNSWRGADLGGMELDHAVPVMKRLSLKRKPK
jgi:ankyrin repeat protein